MKEFTRRIHTPSGDITQTIKYKETETGGYSEIFVNGVLYTRENYNKRYGYDWRASPSGRILLFMSNYGHSISVKKSDLQTKGIEVNE